ncbi:MAG: hypothetical protein M1416_01580 [Candidatus Pacearchaeota archaeon]|nr:hypothetical protein [Candidatus Pacearchaeota archaeon]
MERGKLFVIEGTDFSGKNTQTKLLGERLKANNISYKTMDFPRYDTPTGRIIGQCYLGKEKDYWTGDSGWFGEADSLDPKVASLYYAADRRAAIPEINEILDSGTHLILDRYYQSNMAHQGGKIRDSKERLELFKWLERLELELLELPKEDITIFLHMPTEVAVKLRRDEKKDLHEKNYGHRKRAETTYLQLADLYGWKKIECAPNNKIRTPEDIAEEVYGFIKKI